MAITPKRILLVTRNFPPLVGGMERLIYNAYRELKREFEVLVLGPKGCERHLAPEDFGAGMTTSPTIRFVASCQWQAFKAALAWKPDLVLAGSGVAAPAAWLAARTAGAQAVCMLHGLDISNRNAAYGAGFVPAIRHCDAVIANSRFTASLAEQRGVPRDRIHIIHPGVDEPANVTQDDMKAFRARIGAADRPILLSVGRLAERKGLLEFVTNCLPDIVSRIPDALLVIIGGEAADALIAQKPVAERLKNAIAGLHLENHVAMLGQVDDPSLHIVYAASDLHVFPVLDRPTDIEGFGMVAVEAASYGLPTVAFAVGGVTEAIKHQVSGYLVPAGDYATLRNAILSHLATMRGSNAWKETCAGFAREFYWHRYGKALRSLIDETL